MAAYLGSYGRLVPFAHWREGQSVSGEVDGTFYKTLGGNRVYARSMGFHRSWDLSTSDLDPADAAGVELLLRGGYGPGPHVLVDPNSQVTNVISPGRSLSIPEQLNSVIEGGTAGNGVALPTGLRVPSVRSVGSEVVLWARAAVIPGTPITASVYVTPGARVLLRYARGGLFFADGPTLTRRGASDGVMQRHYETTTPPDGAEWAYFVVRSTTNVAAPAVTWTSTLMPWSPGNGSENVVITGWSKGYSHASSEENDRRDANFKVTVSEVGSGS